MKAMFFFLIIAKIPFKIARTLINFQFKIKFFCQVHSVPLNPTNWINFQHFKIAQSSQNVTKKHKNTATSTSKLWHPSEQDKIIVACSDRLNLSEVAEWILFMERQVFMVKAKRTLFFLQKINTHSNKST